MFIINGNISSLQVSKRNKLELVKIELYLRLSLYSSAFGSIPFYTAENADAPVFKRLFTKKQVSLCCTYSQISAAINRSLSTYIPG